MTTFGNRRKWWIAPLVLVGLTAFGFITMALWNALLPEIFHLPAISFWQAVGLLILSRIFFGGMGHHRPHHHWAPLRHKWNKMTPEEREQFVQHLRNHRRNCNEQESKPGPANS